MEILTPEIGLMLWMAIITFIIILPVVALIHVVTSTFADSTNKLIWVLIILFLPFLGSILYFVVGRKQRVESVK